MGHNHPLLKSFRYAFDGFKTAFKQEPNLRFHLVVAIGAIVAGLFLHLSTTEWSILVITISMVIILELLNTTIEELVDLASPTIHPKAKIAKDVAAAAVLLSAITAVTIGVLLFLPKLLQLHGILY